MMYHVVMQDDTWMSGFVSGLVCGEGNFTIAISRNANCRLGVHARALFQMEMSIVDEALLQDVQRFFDFGYLNYPKPRTRALRESPTCKYIVTDIDGLSRLVKFFMDNPLIGAKQRSFETWAECVAIIRSGQHTSDEGMRQIVNLRGGINQFRRPASYVPPEIHLAALRPTEGRAIHPWSDVELAYLHRYATGEIDRREMVDHLPGRTRASIAARLTRVRNDLDRAE